MRPLVLGGNWISNLILTSISAYWLKNEPLILLVFSFMGLFSQTGENPLFGCAHGICVRKSAIYTVQCCAVLLNQRLGINPAPLMGCFRKTQNPPHGRVCFALIFYSTNTRTNAPLKWVCSCSFGMAFCFVA